MIFDNSHITFALCNYNTTQLTNNAISSIEHTCKHIPHKIVVLDNSDKEKFIPKLKCSVIDNTNNNIINFPKILSSLDLDQRIRNNYASLKHAISINFLLECCFTESMMLFDSDIILKKSIDFIDTDFLTIADIEMNGHLDRHNEKIYMGNTRFLPFIQYFNVMKLNQQRIKYCDFNRIQGIQKMTLYDTGASFYEDVINCGAKFKRINYRNYIDHLEHGSWIFN